MDCCSKQACSKRQLKGLGIAEAAAALFASVLAHILNFTQLVTFLFYMRSGWSKSVGASLAIKISLFTCLYLFCSVELLKHSSTDSAQNWTNFFMWQLMMPCELLVVFFTQCNSPSCRNAATPQGPRLGIMAAWTWTNFQGKSNSHLTFFVHSWPTPLVLMWLSLSWQLQRAVRAKCV